MSRAVSGASTAPRAGRLAGLVALGVAVPALAAPATQAPAGTTAAMATGTMAMDDDTAGAVGTVMLDQLEWRDTAAGGAKVWEGAAWYGGDYDKLWLRTEGEAVNGATDARVELLWSRIVSRWWSLQAGAREDFGNGPPRTWAALGLAGLAPGWLDVEATVYAGESGRTAARVKAATDLLLTQRLILQPEGEANLCGKSDPARDIGSGLSDLQVGLRLRYEVRREFAPYAGVAWQRLFGGTRTDARAAGLDVSGVQVVVGVRVWY